MPTHHFLNYEIEDFVMDDTFRKWVLRPDYELEVIIKEYLEAFPQQKQVIEEARIIVLSLRVQEKQLPPQQWDAIYNAFQAKLTTSAPATPVKRINRFNWKYAAAAFVAITTGLFFFINKKNNVAAPLQYAYATNYGEVKKVTLPDSSIVTLNANSKLLLSQKWNDSAAREVWLEGEAFFEVTKKPLASNKDFIVHTSDMDIQVLGTKFDVKAKDEITRVVLSEGVVKVQSPYRKHSPILMAPGEAVELKNKQKAPEKRKVAPEKFNAWKNKQFILDNTSLKDIGVFIKEYYGRPVLFESDAVANIKLDGTSLPVEDEALFLSIIEKVTNVTIVKNGQELFIKK